MHFPYQGFSTAPGLGEVFRRFLKLSGGRTPPTGWIPLPPGGRTLRGTLIFETQATNFSLKVSEKIFINFLKIFMFFFGFLPFFDKICLFPLAPLLESPLEFFQQGGRVKGEKECLIVFHMYIWESIHVSVQSG